MFNPAATSTVTPSKAQSSQAQPTKALFAPRQPAQPGRLVHGFALGALCLMFVTTLAGFAARPGDNGSYAVLVWPHQGEAALIAAIGAADGVLVRQSRYPWLAIATARGHATPAQFRSSLQAAGIHIVLHPALLAGCFTPVQTLAQSNTSSRPQTS